MSERNVYLYWVGKEYKLISILRSLIYLHSVSGKGYLVNLLTRENIHNYIQNVPPYFDNLLPAHQADYVRVNVICEKGGIWLDSDTLVMSSLDTLFDQIEQKDGFFVTENSTIWNGIFGSRAQTPLMIEWKKRMKITLDNRQHSIRWAEVGCEMLLSMFKENRKLYTNYDIFNGQECIYPIVWNSCVDEFIIKPYDNYKTIVREYQPLIALVNSVYKSLENMTEQQILLGNMPLNYFLNKSLENAKMNSNKLLFENIYKFKLWNNGNPNVPLSGPGSSIQNTRECSKLLDQFIYENNCTNILDLGCGDLNWISKTKFFNDDSIKYTGVDVVESLINSHANTYPNKSFFCKDIITYNDMESASIIIIRDVIFHLKNTEILSIFENIKNKFKYLLITSCRNHINLDTFDRWHFSEKNITIAPFNRKENFEIKISENVFNRDVYIYSHDNFYNT